MSLFVGSIGFGLVTASILAIAAVGFTLQIGIANLFNLTYGVTMIACAFFAYEFNQAGLNIWLCMPLAAAFGTVLSVGLNRILFRPFARRGTSLFGMVIVTMAASFLIGNIMLAIWGPNYFTYRLSQGSTIQAGGIILTESQVAIIVLAVVLMLGLHFLLRGTKIGQAMRATASNPTLARASGIRTSAMIDIVWALSGALSGVAGVALVMNTSSFDFSSGASFMIVVVAAAVLGGVGRPYGAMLGALIVGLATEISPVFLSPAYKNVVAFVILVLVILARPQGLLATARAFSAGQAEEAVA